MSRPCSAWCRPEEGVHVVVTCSSLPLEQARAVAIGDFFFWSGGSDSCIPDGALIRVLDMDAAEVDARLVSFDYGRYPYAMRETLQVLA